MEFQVIFQDNSHPMFEGYLPHPDMDMAVAVCEQNTKGRNLIPGDIIQMLGARFYYSGEVNGKRIWVELPPEASTPRQIEEVKEAKSLDTLHQPVLECSNEEDITPVNEVVTSSPTTPVITKTVPGRVHPPSSFTPDAQKVKTPLKGYAPKLEKEKASEGKVERAKPPSTSINNKNLSTPTPSSPPLSTVDSVVKRCQDLAASKVA